VDQRYDPYAILGISPAASDQEIRRAYRRAALKYHPDSNCQDSSAEQRFRRISEAYRMISRSRRRGARYDRRPGRVTSEAGPVVAPGLAAYAAGKMDESFLRRLPGARRMSVATTNEWALFVGLWTAALLAAVVLPLLLVNTDLGGYLLAGGETRGIWMLTAACLGSYAAVLTAGLLAISASRKVLWLVARYFRALPQPNDRS